MKRIRIKGHGLKRQWKGCESSYADGYCECGQWHYKGWTERMGNVIRAHNNHLADVQAKKSA